MKTELKCMFGWIISMFMTGIFAAPLLRTLTDYILATCVGICAFISGVCFTFAAYESVHPSDSKKNNV